MKFIKDTPLLEAFDLKDLLKEVEAEREVKILCENEAVTLFVQALDEGVEIPEHSPPGEVFLHLLEGEVNILMGEQSINVSEGQTLVMHAHEPRKLFAVKKSKFMLLLIKG